MKKARRTPEEYEEEHLDDNLEHLIQLVKTCFQDPRFKNFLEKIDVTSLSPMGPMLVRPHPKTGEDIACAKSHGLDQEKSYVVYGIELAKGTMCYALKDEDSNDFALVPSRLFVIERNHLCSDWRIERAIDESAQDRIFLHGF